MVPLINLFSTEGVIFILLAILVIFLLMLRDRRKEIIKKELEKNRLSTVDDAISQYGEPDNLVVVNPTRGNDTEGTILEYKSQNLLIINGMPVEKQHVRDVSFSNFAVPYVPNDYKIIVITDIPGQDVIHVPLGAGNDARYANQVVKQVKALMG